MRAIAMHDMLALCRTCFPAFSMRECSAPPFCMDTALMRWTRILLWAFTACSSIVTLTAAEPRARTCHTVTFSKYAKAPD